MPSGLAETIQQAPTGSVADAFRRSEIEVRNRLEAALVPNTPSFGMNLVQNARDALGGAGNDLLSGLENAAVNTISSAISNVTGLNSSVARAGVNGLISSIFGGGGNANTQVMNGNAAQGPISVNDWRIKVSGVFGTFTFPVTPNINITHSAKYSTASLTHSNFGAHFYESSDVSSIQINGDFPCQNEFDAAYLMKGIYMIRAFTKMFWHIGSPPPLLFIDGYGGYFQKVPCVLTNFTHTMPDNVDYISSGPIPGGEAMVPVISSLQLSLQPIYSRSKVDKFDLTSYALGELSGEGFI